MKNFLRWIEDCAFESFLFTLMIAAFILGGFIIVGAFLLKLYLCSL
jgi:hypothetical protein